ncbi:MAG: flagellar assembly peptidoglycan hydrolase FlgJ [Xanthobacteraceae bacterium]
MTAPLALLSLAGAALPQVNLTASLAAARTGGPAKAKAAAEDFEAVFLNSMFNQMFTAIDGEGPFGTDGGTGVWRSFLAEEYAKSFAKNGGIGIASHVYDTLLAQQEAAAPAMQRQLPSTP